MNIKYMGENAISYLIEKCKSTFALITHKHTASEVGADVQGSASAALVLAEQYTDEAVAQKSQVQMVKVNETDSETETLSTLKIHKLTRSQYEQMVEDGTIDENSIYLTQDDDYSNEDLDEILANKSDVNHNHDNIYETKEDAQLKYDELVATKADKEHIHSWNDLEDKPFGEDVAYVTYAEGEVSTDSEHTEGDGVFYGYLDDIFAIEVGKAYNVTIDGVLYENVECYAKNDYYGSPYLGASSGEEIKNNTSQYPFQVTFEGYYKTYMVYTKENAIHTVKVEEVVSSVKQIEEKYIPDTIVRIDHSHSWNDLEDKPFYETEAVEVELVPETTASNFIEQDYYGVYYNCNIPVDYYVSFSLDKTYTVIWDGIRYDNVTCQDTLGGAMIGSSERQIAGAYGETNEYPFGIIMYDSGDGYELQLIAETGQTHTVKVVEPIKEAEIKTIDPKYLPETIARTEYVDANFALKSDLQNIDLSALETKTDAQLKYDELTAIKAEKNHSHSWNDLEDKPFYETIVEGEVLCEFNAIFDSNEPAQVVDCPIFDLIVGESYQVVIDGIEYEPTVCKEIIDYHRYKVLGNSTLYTPYLGENSGEDYTIVKDVTSAGGAVFCFVKGKANQNSTIRIIEGKTKEIVPIDEKFLPDSVFVQADWNVNDETSLAFVKNRIGGYYVDSEAILFDDNFTLGSNSNTTIDNQDFELVLGETYQVVIDGVEYEPTVCKEYKSMYATYKVLGNPYLHNAGYENSGEEYLWMDKFHFFMTGKSNTTVSVKIIGKAKEIVPINEKFLPDSIARTTYVDENFALKSDLQNIDLSSLETKEDSQSKLDEAKAYADSAASTVKNDLLNGAGAAYDTLKELGELIDENQDAIGALETVAANKADKEHDHEGVYEEVGSIEFAKAEIKAYVDEALASKIVVQIHTWEADD